MITPTLLRGGKLLSILTAALVLLSILIACGQSASISTTNSTPTSQGNGLTYVGSLQQGEVFVAYGKQIIVRKPDNNGSTSVLLEAENGVLAYGVDPGKSSVQFIVDMSPDAAANYKTVNTAADFEKLYCAGYKLYGKEITKNVPQEWLNVTC